MATNAGTSRVLGEKDRVADGTPSCEIRFVYAGSPPENLFWNEPCAHVSEEMVDRRFLEQNNKCNRLDSFQRRFVEAMPSGRVVYVEGSSSASIYPMAETSAIEVAVAD